MQAPALNRLIVTPEILNLISELDEFKGRWTATQILAPERLAALRQVATIESVGSSTRIEGVKLTNTQIESLLRGVKAFSFRSRDEQEVAGYAEAMELVFQSFREIPLSENHIKQLHKVLLQYSAKDDRHRGEYKKVANTVEAFGPDGKSKGVIFKTATPFATPMLTKNLVGWTNLQLNQKEIHPLLIIALFVLVFLQIHPFHDGNGRLSRVLTTLLLLQVGYTYVPYSSFERVIEESKNAYYLALRRGQSELETKAKKTKISQKSDGLQDWVVYFLRSMQKQKRALEFKLKEELETVKLPQLSLRILELIRSRGPLSIAEILAGTKANRNTLKLYLRNLVADGLLAAEGRGRRVRYHLASRSEVL